MRVIEWAEIARRRRTLTPAMLAVATSRRTRRHRPRTADETTALIEGVRVTYRHRVAAGDLEWLGPRALRVRT